MKHVIGVTLVLMAFAVPAQAKHYECYRYVNGEPTGSYVNIVASNQSEAERLGYKKLKSLGGQVDYAKCNYKAD